MTIFWVAAVCGAIALVIWMQHQSEKMGVDARRWRTLWLTIIVGGAIAVYLLIANRNP